eukprot:Rmarinus@m.15677
MGVLLTNLPILFRSLPAFVSPTYFVLTLVLQVDSLVFIVHFLEVCILSPQALRDFPRIQRRLRFRLGQNLPLLQVFAGCGTWTLCSSLMTQLMMFFLLQALVQMPLEIRKMTWLGR